MAMNKNNKSNLVKVFISIILIGSFIYYFFGKNPERLFNDLLNKVDYLYVMLSIIFGGIAYISRGIRWIILINAIGHQVSKKHTISAVSFSYFANLFIPRAGEIARCTALKKSDNIPVDKLFGTILIERIIDFVFLIVFGILCIVLKSSEINNSINSYNKFVNNDDSNIGPLSIIIIFVFITGGYIFKNKIKKLKIYSKTIAFFIGIKEGLKSIKKIDNKVMFWVHTVIIWVMYFAMTAICFFAIPETSNLNISDGLFLLVIGGIGMVIPSPGGIGTYHFLVMIGLVAIQVPQGIISLNPYNEYNPAFLFPFIVHSAQTLLALLSGAVGFYILFRNKKTN